jgi:2-(1,2-epoxy-1,2-dihydrophenyl)acetyl-CoA isomerase
VAAYETISLDVRVGVAHLTLNRPDAANGINLALARELLDATKAIAADPAARVVLLTGAGARFCAGGDLKGFAAIADLPDHLRELLGLLHEAVANLVRGEAPVVAAVQGSAAGAGLGLVGASDLVLAGTSTKFVMAYTGVGLTPDGSSSWFLPRLVGLRRALELALTNRILSADEAETYGLITSVVPDDELAARAETMAASLAAGAPHALAAAKRLLHGSLETTLESHLAQEAEAIANASGSPEGAEGIAAFLEKRPPRFPHG